jgi:hypothetical protein
MNEASFGPPGSRPRDARPRPFLGTELRNFRSGLAPEDALARLEGALQGPGVEGDRRGDSAWLRARSPMPPPPPVLRLTVVDTPDGARVAARFDPSPLAGADVWVYAVATMFGLFVIALWLLGALPPDLRALLTQVFPVLLAALSAMALAQFALAWLQRRRRHRVLDLIIDTLAIEPE